MRTVNFASTGSGKPVVALHGYGLSLFSWRHLPPALTERRVIRIDLPGHGSSPVRTDNRYALSDHARLIIDFVAEQSLGEFDLIGHSMGGGVALLIATELAERGVNRVNSLVLVDSVALPQRLPVYLALARMPVLGPLSLSLLPARLIVGLVLRGTFYDPSRITKEMVEVYAQNLASRERRQALVATARQIIPADLPSLIERYHRLKLPTLLIWGRQDAIVPPAIGTALNKLIAGSELILIDKTSDPF